jgi:GxxExxY protein
MEKDSAENVLCRKIIGIAFEIYNQLEYGLLERVYQKSFEQLLKNNNISHSKGKYGKIEFRGHLVG